MHRQIYVKRPDIGAVVHAHTKKCMAVSATEVREVPCITEEMSQLLGGAIPLTLGYVPAGEHAKLGEAAAHDRREDGSDSEEPRAGGMWEGHRRGDTGDEGDGEGVRHLSVDYDTGTD